MRNFILSITMLVSMTACQNGENLTSNAPEEVQKQTFQSKAAARGEELPKLSPEEEKAFIKEAIKYLQEDRDANLKGEGGTGRAAQILCHTNYNSSYGHACVYNSSGYLVTVSWEPQPRTGDIGTVGGPVHYHGSVASQCNC